MDNEQIKKSLANQVAKSLTFEVKETTTVIKEYTADDLPAYFKWTAGSTPWYFRVRNRDGKIVTDLLRKQLDGWELTYSTVTSAFDKSNEPIPADEWRNTMHSYIKELQ